MAEGSVKQPENVQAPSGTSRIFQILTAAAWPLAVVLALHRTVITAFNGTATDDFTTVYNALSRALTGLPVYDQAYHHVDPRSEEHTSELQSRFDLVCRLLLEKKKQTTHK